MIRIQSYADIGYRPGLIGRLAALQAQYYAPRYHFGLEYEAATTADLSAFLGRFDPDRDAFWVVTREGEPVGSAAIDGSGGRGLAQLRWVFLAPELRGYGLGKALLARALDFSLLAGFERVELHTHGGLEAAVHLYERAGFELAEESEDFLWGRSLRVRRYVLPLPRADVATPAPALAAPA